MQNNLLMQLEFPLAFEKAKGRMYKNQWERTERKGVRVINEFAIIGCRRSDG
jgi:hypothetical protein